MIAGPTRLVVFCRRSPPATIREEVTLKPPYEVPSVPTTRSVARIGANIGRLTDWLAALRATHRSDQHRRSGSGPSCAEGYARGRLRRANSSHAPLRVRLTTTRRRPLHGRSVAPKVGALTRRIDTPGASGGAGRSRKGRRREGTLHRGVIRLGVHLDVLAYPRVYVGRWVLHYHPDLLLTPSETGSKERANF